MKMNKVFLTLTLLASLCLATGTAEALTQSPISAAAPATTAAPVTTAPPAAPAAGVPAVAASAPAAPATLASGPAATAAANSAAEQLAKLQMESLILAAKAKNAKLAADIRNAEKETSQASASPTLAAPLPGVATGAGVAGLMGASTAGPAMNSLDLVAIRAYDGRYLASIQVGGRTVEKGQGETLDGGWRVASIGANSVKLVRRKGGKDEVRTLGL